MNELDGSYSPNQDKNPEQKEQEIKEGFREFLEFQTETLGEQRETLEEIKKRGLDLGDIVTSPIQMLSDAGFEFEGDIFSDLEPVYQKAVLNVLKEDLGFDEANLVQEEIQNEGQEDEVKSEFFMTNKEGFFVKRETDKIGINIYFVEERFISEIVAEWPISEEE
ncbi:MAG: hypothetical protein M1355_02645 [Patescibacteria group bacterium]|nr:hypothetical protein [Patescibacteria group bacterium]